jgi:hypothetical protein
MSCWARRGVKRNFIARGYAREAREAARQLRIELIERHVRSVDELRDGLQRLKPGQVDALFVSLDAMVTSQTALIVDTARSCPPCSMSELAWRQVGVRQVTSRHEPRGPNRGEV